MTFQTDKSVILCNQKINYYCKAPNYVTWISKLNETKPFPYSKMLGPEIEHWPTKASLIGAPPPLSTEPRAAQQQRSVFRCFWYLREKEKGKSPKRFQLGYSSWSNKGQLNEVNMTSWNSLDKEIEFQLTRKCTGRHDVEWWRRRRQRWRQRCWRWWQRQQWWRQRRQRRNRSPKNAQNSARG